MYRAAEIQVIQERRNIRPEKITFFFFPHIYLIVYPREFPHCLQPQKCLRSSGTLCTGLIIAHNRARGHPVIVRF